MRIAQISSLWFRTPPQRYGGAEMSISLLTEGLVKRGYDVTLFASGDSITKARLVYPYPVSFDKTNFDSTSQSSMIYLTIHNLLQEHAKKKFDIIHFHLATWNDFVYFLFVSQLKTRCLFTMRYTIPDKKAHPLEYEMLSHFRKLNFVSISKSQQENKLKLNWVASIYNSLDQNIFSYNRKQQNYFLWIGSIHPIKGLHLAIKAAKKTKSMLIIAGKINKHIPIAYNYWLKKIRPHIDGKQIIYRGETNKHETATLMKSAKALLNPIQWDEPFGLVMVESLSCGTPVIVFDRGSAKEIVIDGKTGYIVKNINEMMEKMRQVTYLNRYDCYEHVKNKFNQEKMISSYEKVYKLIS